MKQRLEELLFEWTLRKLLDTYDPDRVFRFLANSCVLFNIEMEDIQKIIFILLDRSRTSLLVFREILSVLTSYGFQPRAISILLHVPNNMQFRNRLRYQRIPGPCVLTDEQRRQAMAFYYHLHQLGVMLL